MAESRSSTILSTALTICAIVVTALVVRRELFPPSARPGPSRVAAWRSFQSAGHVVGPADAPVTIVEFSDYQCPACAMFAPVLKAAQEAHPRDVKVVYRHLPIPGHPYAMGAAIAAECAGAQGRFEPMHAALYREQSAFGTRPWVAIAASAGVADTAAFTRCLGDSTVAERVRADSRAGIAMGARATPTILVNDMMSSGAESASSLEALIARARRSD